MRSEAKRRVLLAIHLDTVYPMESAFQSVVVDGNMMYGPGVADAKGGIAVMLIALETLERFVAAAGITDFGWDVLLNPDEEIGSPCSTQLFEAAAERNHVGLLFEPALPDGNLAGERKGSANFQIVCRGKSAHAGRHFDEGINAVVAASDVALQVHALNHRFENATFNVAKIAGGGPTNMVPDIAVVRLNVRYSDVRDESEIEEALSEILNLASVHHKVRCKQHGDFTTPPKPMSGLTQALFSQIQQCGETLGLQLNHQPTGGVCDGNRLAAHGLPNIDTLGPCGGNIHSPEEFLILRSLTERAELTASLLIGWATGEIEWCYSRTIP